MFKRGNTFWKLRDTHGRKRLFEDPWKIWELAQEYFKFCDENPEVRHEQVSKHNKVKIVKEIDEITGEEVETAQYQELIAVPLGRPYTLDGFCLYTGVSHSYYDAHLRELPKTDPTYSDFLAIFNTIKEICREQQLRGAAVGVFKENLMARLNGIHETVKTELTGAGGGPVQVESPLDGLSIEELKALKYGKKD